MPSKAGKSWLACHLWKVLTGIAGVAGTVAGWLFVELSANAKADASAHATTKASCFTHVDWRAAKDALDMEIANKATRAELNDVARGINQHLQQMTAEIGNMRAAIGQLTGSIDTYMRMQEKKGGE